MGATTPWIKQHENLLASFRSFSTQKRQRRRPGHSTRRSGGLGSKTLHLERLEERFFLDAGSLLPAVSPLWFEDVAPSGTPWHVASPDLSSQGVDWSEQADSSALSDEGVYDWIVRFHTKSVEQIGSVAETAGLLIDGGLEFEVIRGLGLTGQVLVRSSGGSVDSVSESLAGNTYVAGYELDGVQESQLYPNDPQYGWLWGLENTATSSGVFDADIDASAAWEISTGSSGVVVAVIDTGVDYTHPDLVSNIWTNPGEIAGNGIDDDGNGFVDDVHGYDFCNNDGNPMDDHGHGTHVAGTIGATGDNGLGITGVNWSSSIMGLKFLSSDGSGYTSDAVRAVNYATMMQTTYGVNVRVTNNSWGGGSFSFSMQDAIRASGEAEILFVAAAGNDSTDNDSVPHYPSNYNLSNVISVAATDNSDHLAYFSNYGDSTVHLAAPGLAIYSTVPGGEYAWYSGTSMATPHVAGVAALAWSVAPEAGAAEIRSALLESTDAVASLSGKVITGGRLNALGTLQLLAEDTPQAPVVTSLSASPTLITAGTPATLTAHGVMDPDGIVSSVSFYADSNGSGQYDDGDQLVGIDSSVAGSEASIALSTTGLAVGPHTFFARALDDDGQWSSAAEGTLTIVPPDDHGNDAGSATGAAVGSTVDGFLEWDGDVDWFAFDASAGTTYVLQTVLTGLPDSVLSLYDQDGSTLLHSNDDVSWPDHPNSQITWTAGATGTYYLAVEASGESQTGGYQLELQTIVDDHGGSAAAATPVAVGASVEGSIQFATDADWFAFEAVAGGRYLLQTELTGLPDSVLSLYAPDGSTLLCSNDDVSWPDDVASRIDWTAQTGGTYFLAVEAYDGSETGAYRVHLDLVNHVPLIEPIADQTIAFDQDAVDVLLAASDADGDPLSFSAEILPNGPYAQSAYDLDQQLHLDRHDSGYFEDCYGAGEKFVVGDAGWYFILPGGEFYAWDGSIAGSELIATLDAGYHADPTLLHDALRPSVRDGEVVLSLDGNRLTIDPIGEYVGTFYVRVTVGDGTDTTVETFEVTREAPPSTDLGTVDLCRIEGLDLAGGELLYVLQAPHDGWLTVEAVSGGATDSLTLTLYDEHFRESAAATGTPGGERIDFSVKAGEVYFVGLAGNSADVDLSLTNLVDHDGHTVTVHGTGQDDSLRFSVGEVYELTIDGVFYQFSPDEVSAITFEGGAGRDSAVLRGSAGNETAVVYPHSATLRGSGYEVVLSGVAQTAVHGGGGFDKLCLYDSAGNDALIATPDHAELYGDGFYVFGSGFDVVQARATAGGRDRAVLFDSAGNDSLITAPACAELYGDDYYIFAGGFDVVHARATAGGTDRATLFDSAGDDTLISTPAHAEIYGDGFYVFAGNFDVVSARARYGGRDRAVFFDSAGNDRFSATSAYAELYGDGFYNFARNFDVVGARAREGGHDLAVLYDSAGDDTFVGTPAYAELYGDGFYNFAGSFDAVHARASSGGNDLAILCDSAGNDTFIASAAYAEFLGSGFYNLTSGFERVWACATQGGSDARHIRAVDYALAMYGTCWRRS